MKTLLKGFSLLTFYMIRAIRSNGFQLFNACFYRLHLIHFPTIFLSNVYHRDLLGSQWTMQKVAVATEKILCDDIVCLQWLPSCSLVGRIWEPLRRPTKMVTGCSHFLFNPTCWFCVLVLLVVVSCWFISWLILLEGDSSSFYVCFTV